MNTRQLHDFQEVLTMTRVLEQDLQSVLENFPQSPFQQSLLEYQKQIVKRIIDIQGVYESYQHESVT